MVDSLVATLDRAKEEFTGIINDPFMRNSAILIFANKQDMKNCLSAAEIAERMGLGLRCRWRASAVAAGPRLCEGLDWLSDTLKQIGTGGRDERRDERGTGDQLQVMTRSHRVTTRRRRQRRRR